MNDLEISRRLALAIGWAPDNIRVSRDAVYVGMLFDVTYWWAFDYTDCEVIWPIAERFNAFPELDCGTMQRWSARCWAPDGRYQIQIADTAAKATALAIIGGQSNG